MSLEVSDAANPFASTQAVDSTTIGTTTTFGDAGDTTTKIEFGLPTPGSSAVKGGTRPTAGFKITFNVRRGDTQTPNSLDVTIYNLSEETMNQVSTKEFRTIKLQAGYPGNFGLLFQGEIKQVRKGRTDAKDSYLTITAADGDSAYNYSAMALTLAAGSKPTDSIQQIVKSMASGAVSRGYTPDLPANGFVRNRVFWGMTKDELYDFCEAYDLTASIQDGKLTFIPNQGYIPGKAVVISPQTGLLSVPEQTQNGIECAVLLNPNIKIGQLVQLQNTAINQLRYGVDLGSQGANYQLTKTVKLNAQGLYYVLAADHVGDTRGPPWETKLTLLSVDAQIPQSQISRTNIQPGTTAIRRN
ncbi:MAG: hypothetical protein JSR66_03135 [Proteobacteria bacterium]|nr:hypothetical protein [Pseudomonadota bacterium]